MATAEFSKFAGILSAALSQHSLSGFEIAQLDSITSTSFVPTISWQIDGETMETVADFVSGAPKSLWMVTAAMQLKNTYSLEGKL